MNFLQLICRISIDIGYYKLSLLGKLETADLNISY